MVECAVCLETCIKKYSPKCLQCQKQVCVKCVSKLVKVCSSGCACFSWACPSCRGKTTGLIAHVNNASVNSSSPIIFAPSPRIS